MHEEVLAWVCWVGAPAGAKVLDVGGRDINGSARVLFPDAAKYVAIDLVDGPGADVVADICDWADRRRFDVVLCLEVLEHTPAWADVLAACWKRVLKGGRLIVTCATTGREPHSAIDGGPLREGEHYANLTAEDVLSALPDVVFDVEVDPVRGDLYLAATK